MNGKARSGRFRVQAEIRRHEKAWGSALVKIFDGDTQVGEYERNHPGWAEQTFEPLESNGSWYALYSRDYTSTRVMSLPECRDLGGEESASHGFCPVEFYVPRYKKVFLKDRTGGQEQESWWFEDEAEETEDRTAGWLRNYDLKYGPWLSLTTGFVGGCLWGDDRTWKLEVIDLEHAASGEIRRSARFGHIQLARGMSLARSLRFDREMPYWELRATVIRQERRDVATGDLIDPYDE